MVWPRPLGPGIQEGTPLVHDGVMYLPNPSGRHPGHRRRHGRPAVGVQAPVARMTSASSFPVPYDQPQPGDLRQPDHRHQRRRLRVCARRADRQACLGNADRRLSENAAQRDVRPDHRRTARSSPAAAASRKAGRTRCVITAHDAETGKELWRTRTIPRPGEPGDETWGDVPYEQRRHVGAWMVPSYDPELNLFYIGTSVTSPAPKFMLGRQRQAATSITTRTLALDADTGKIVWYYQHLVDHWDLDHPFERMLRGHGVAPDPARCAGSIRSSSPASGARWSPASPARPASSTRSIARTGEFLWATADGPAERDRATSTAHGRSHGEPGVTVHRSRARTPAVCPGVERRQELAGRRLQPAHQRDVLPAAESPA